MPNCTEHFLALIAKLWSQEGVKCASGFRYLQVFRAFCRDKHFTAVQEPEVWTKSALDNSTFCGEKHCSALCKDFTGGWVYWKERWARAAFSGTFQVCESHSVSSRATLLCSAGCPPLLSVCLLFNTGYPSLSVSKCDLILLISSICLSLW